MRLKDFHFLVRSPTGITHAINPTTNSTYCGYPHIAGSTEACGSLDVTTFIVRGLEDMGWRFLDKTPSDENPPSCKICRNHYDDPIKSVLREIVEDLETNIHEYLSLRVMLKDVKAIGRFTSTIADFMKNEKKLKAKMEAKP